MSDRFDVKNMEVHERNAICSRISNDIWSSLTGKVSVNFDDPTTCHLYFGDEVGRPGTILTFFPWPDAPKGRKGIGQVITISFLIPINSINYWIDRCKNQEIHFQGPTKRSQIKSVLAVARLQPYAKQQGGRQMKQFRILVVHCGLSCVEVVCSIIILNILVSSDATQQVMA
jgi:catechol 2,3-dioxygenase-like lactoylglutathione lyase family enzyme